MKKILIVIGVVGLAAWLLTMKGSKRLSPWEKMAIDVLNPSTAAGREQRKYLDSVSLPHSTELLLTFVEYRIAHPEDSYSIAYNKKSSWMESETVPV